MQTLYYATLVDVVLHEIDSLLNNYIYHGYTALSDYLEAPLATFITLYIIIMGYGIVGGWVTMSMTTFIKSITRIGLIYLFAMNWSWFSQYVVDLFFSASGQLAAVLIAATPVPLPTFAGEGIDGAMQAVLIELWDIGQWIWDAGSIRNIGAFIGSIGILGAGGLLIGYALFELVMAKCMLSLLLVVAPLFVILALFDSTQDYFNRWLGSCSGYAFLMILISATIALSMSIAQWSIGDAFITQAADIRILQILPIIFMSILCLGLLKRSSLLALGIGASVAMFSRNKELGGGIAQFVFHSVKPLGIATRRVVQSTYRRKETVHTSENKEKISMTQRKLQQGD